MPALAMWNREADDAVVLPRMERSWIAAEAVGRYFSLKRPGLLHKSFKPSIRPDIRDREAHVDGGVDLLLWWPGKEDDKFRIETKWRSFNFTCAKDFPYETVYLDKVNEAKTPAVAYVTVSKNLLYAAIAYTSKTKDFWGRESSGETKARQTAPTEKWSLRKDRLIYVRLPDCPDLQAEIKRLDEIERQRKINAVRRG